jgi:DNA-directed RNA polymerase
MKLLIDTATIAKEEATSASPYRARGKAFTQQIPEDMEPAFEHFITYVKSKKVGSIRCKDQVLNMLNLDEVHKGILQTRYMPMVVPPQPWLAPDKGCYLTSVATTRIMRTKGSRLQFEVLRTAKMDPVYRSLNILSSTPWAVNQPMCDVIFEAWERGGGIADLPSRTNVEVPTQLPENYETDPDVKKKFDFQVRKAKRTNYNLHSLRCDTILKLHVARECRNKVFYFPHNLDFRGRTYPIPPHLNHLGQDLCRGLLTFAEGKPLGATGLRWLKIHLSNVYGNDKVPFASRVSFVESKMKEIMDSADRPLEGARWWLTADKPWQCLATCMELTNALRSPDPTKYISHLPVHQDGSCNGLQHYAALGGDELGAKQVNLLPSDCPQDVYSGVVELVVRRLNEDAERGVPIACVLKGKVDRKVIKQTVMTSVYGVTMIGARKQIQNALKDKKVLDDEQMFDASMYLTKATFASIKEMFSGAREIMEWLGNCAKLVALSGKPVTWVTPLGLPVVQPYRAKAGKRSVVTVLQTVILTESNDDLPVNARKHQTAFPPNYVHSLDSTHMMLTAMACHADGLTFASVHDSFWTHAATVEKMNVHLRNSFVDLHKQPLLENLLKHFKANHPDIAFPPLPHRGGFDLERIKESPYFFQ